MRLAYQRLNFGGENMEKLIALWNHMGPQMRKRFIDLLIDAAKLLLEAAVC